MNAATQWFKFDPSSIGTPMPGEWCLWSFITKHGRETYSGRWIVHGGSDLIVTDRGWSVPLVVGEAYFARVIHFDNGAADLLIQSAEKKSAEPPPFDMVMAGGFVISFSMKTNLKIGDQITFWDKRYIVWDRNEKDGFVKYSLTPDSIPEVKYMGSTPHGEQISYDQRRAEASAYSDAGAKRVANTPPPVNQKYPPGTRVRIADDLGPAMRHFPKGRMATVRYTYAHAFGDDDVKSYWLDVDGIGETGWYNEDQLTAVYYREGMKIGPPTETMIEDAGEPSTFVQDRLAEWIEPEPDHTSKPIRYLQLTDYEKEGQLFQIEFREDLFELKVQNENGKAVVLTLTERELRDAEHPINRVRDFMIDAGVPEELVDEPAKWTLNYRWPTLETIDFKTPRSSDGPIPALVTIIAPDGQEFSWDVQGEIKDGALLSPNITPELWKEICDWQEAWVPAR